MSALVPPTSMKMPSETCSCMSAPAMPAAGPESMVWIGRRATSSTVITPPSDRMIISGTRIPACATACAVIVAVPTIFGRIAPLRTAVRVRVRKPYSALTSCPLVAHRPAALAASTMASSTEGSSTAKASLTTITSVPAVRNVSMALAAAAAASTGSSIATKACSGCSALPGASGTGGTRVSIRAFQRSPRRPAPITPTRDTSPSSSALVACVVEWAMNTTSSGAASSCPSSWRRPSMMPRATPSAAWWVVGTLSWATMANESASTATTSVNVPPTSTPMRRRVAALTGTARLRPAARRGTRPSWRAAWRW